MWTCEPAFTRGGPLVMTGTQNRLHLPTHFNDRRVSRLKVNTAARIRAFQLAYRPVPVATIHFPSRPSRQDATLTLRAGARVCAAIATPAARITTVAAITPARVRNLDGDTHDRERRSTPDEVGTAETYQRGFKAGPRLIAGGSWGESILLANETSNPFQYPPRFRVDRERAGWPAVSRQEQGGENVLVPAVVDHSFSSCAYRVCVGARGSRRAWPRVRCEGH